MLASAVRVMCLFIQPVHLEWPEGNGKPLCRRPLCHWPCFCKLRCHKLLPLAIFPQAAFPSGHVAATYAFVCRVAQRRLGIAVVHQRFSKVVRLSKVTPHVLKGAHPPCRRPRATCGTRGRASSATRTGSWLPDLFSRVGQWPGCFTTKTLASVGVLVQ